MKRKKIQECLLCLKVASQKKMLKIDIQYFDENKKILLDLYLNGFIQGYVMKKQNTITVYLKYDTFGLPIIKNIICISKASNLVYMSRQQMIKFLNCYNYL
jgi:ribosomal protein S8